MKYGSERLKNMQKNSAFWIILFDSLVQNNIFSIFIVFKNKIIGILLLYVLNLVLASSQMKR